MCRSRMDEFTRTDCTLTVPIQPVAEIRQMGPLVPCLVERAQRSIHQWNGSIDRTTIERAHDIVTAHQLRSVDEEDDEEGRRDEIPNLVFFFDEAAGEMTDGDDERD